jgi:hypothetical protein
MRVLSMAFLPGNEEATPRDAAAGGPLREEHPRVADHVAGVA